MERAYLGNCPPRRHEGVLKSFCFEPDLEEAHTNDVEDMKLTRFRLPTEAFFPSPKVTTFSKAAEPLFLLPIVVEVFPAKYAPKIIFLSPWP